MKIYGLGRISDFLSDNIVYRNLNPADQRLPPLKLVAKQIHIQENCIPRKSESNYAKVIVYLLNNIHSLDFPNTKIKNLVFIGDTQLLDVTAYTNICHEGGWNGIAFIGSENQKPPSFEINRISENQKVYFSNRWIALDKARSEGIFKVPFTIFCEEQGIFPSEETVLVVDLDKTALGARGRNGHVIDKARVQAVQDTIASMLGNSFDLDAFKQVYDIFNQPEYHHFTADNQDYLCYICLIIQSGFYSFDDIFRRVKTKEINSFVDFINSVELRKQELPVGLLSVHESVYLLTLSGDPTPFKAFRYNEYKTTIEKMGCIKDNRSIDEAINDEIMITKEVSDLAISWKKQGVLVFGLSDKPDEATFPPANMASAGYQPLHKTETHILGE